MPRQPRLWPARPGDVDPDREGEPHDHGEQHQGRLAGGGHAAYRSGMCRSIKTLRRPGEAATTGELEAAARQYVRKLSGYREPSVRNQAAFEAAIHEVAEASRRLVEAIGVDVEDGPNRWVGRDGAIHFGT